MAKYTQWFNRVLDRLSNGPLPAGDPDQPAPLATAERHLARLDELADTDPDSLHASAYRAVRDTMAEELKFIVDDLDRGRLNDQALATAVEQWQDYGRAYLAQNALPADQVFPQPSQAPAFYDPAHDVAAVRGWIGGDLRRAEANGDEHRAAVLRDFDAQLNSMVELYTLQAAQHRSTGRADTPDLDREAFRRELLEHAAYFSGKVHPGPPMQLPYDVMPKAPSHDPELNQRYEELFSAKVDWSSKVRHPILATSLYRPPAGASAAVRDHAAAVHAWALAEAKQARTDSRYARQDALNDYADDMASLLDQYETRATAQPSQINDADLTGLDLHAFGDALEYAAGLGNANLTDDDQIVLPEHLRTGSALGDEDPAAVAPRLTLRRHELFPGLGADQAVASDDLVDYFGNVNDWLALDPPDLGHRAVIAGLSQQADRAVAAGEFDSAARYRELALDILDQAQSDEWDAVDGALSAGDRRAHIAEQRTLIEARLHHQVERYGLVLPGTDADADLAAGVGVAHDDVQMIENAVQHAYDMIITERAAERQFDHEAANDDDPVRLDQLTTRLKIHRRLTGAEPYTPEQIDAALQRLTTSATGPRAELLDHDHHGEKHPAVRLTYNTADDATGGDGLADPSDPASYLTPEQKIAAEAMEAPDLGHDRIAERLAELADEAAEGGSDEREERLRMLVDDVRFAAAADKYHVVHIAAAGSDSDADFARARRDLRTWVKQQADNLYVELPPDLIDDADTTGDEQANTERADDAVGAARREELAAEFEAAEHDAPQRLAEPVAIQGDEQAPIGEGIDDTERAEGLWELDDQARAVPHDSDDGAAITSEAPQVEASQSDNAAAAQEPAAVANVDRVERSDEASDETAQVDDGAGRDEDARDEVKAATETSACSAAISRAQRSVEQVHERIEVDQQARDERDDELARWHADDRAAETHDEQAIEDTGPALGDDQQV